jgi:hypothetical protein
MRKALRVTALVAFVSALAYAETWTGKLVDASCAAQQKNAACTPNASTTSFGLQASGKTMKLDAEGNQKAAAAVKEHNASADRAKNPNAPPLDVVVTITGTMSGDEIKVEAIQVN